MPFVYAPRFCPVCNEETWNEQSAKIRAQDDGALKGLAWNQEFARYGPGAFARELYLAHTTRYHPEFASWEKRMNLYTFVDGLAFLGTFLPFFVSLVGGLSTAPLFGVPFTLFLVLSAILFLNMRRRKNRFRDSWKEEHGVFDASRNT